jgi:2-keto-4-pentenoate hydratase/2-oxohepta-3-ene-1,7-dioic acid hydratase in catechol pathway
MIFPIPRIIEHVTRYVTLLPGDVIFTGTPPGIGPMKAGDEVEVEIEGIGVLHNPVLDAEPAKHLQEDRVEPAPETD